MTDKKSPQKSAKTPPPLIRRDNEPPTLINQNIPPVKREGSFPLAFFEQTVDVSDFVEFLHQIDLDGPTLFQKYAKILEEREERVEKSALVESKKISESGLPKAIPTIAGPKFDRATKLLYPADSCYAAIAAAVVFAKQRNLLAPQKLNLLKEQTRSFCQNLGLPAGVMAERLDRGLTVLSSINSLGEISTPHEYISLIFSLRVMNLMVLVHYPEVLAWIHPEGLDKFLNEDYLLELCKPEEGVSTYALLALMKALDCLCLFLVQEGKSRVRIYRPAEGFVENIGLYRVGEQFYILEGS